MGTGQQLFLGSEARASGALNRYELRRYYRAIMPNVYLDKRVEPSLRQRTVAAYLWSRREAVVSGLAASALHGEMDDDDSPVELIWDNARSPDTVVTLDALLLENEIQRLDGLQVTTPERTAFDLGRCGRQPARALSVRAGGDEADARSGPLNPFGRGTRHAASASSPSRWP